MFEADSQIMNTDFDGSTILDVLETLLDMMKGRTPRGDVQSTPDLGALERLVRAIRQMDNENRELRLRVAALTRLLITNGVFSADDFAVSVAEMRSIVATSPSAMARGNHAGHNRIPV